MASGSIAISFGVAHRFQSYTAARPCPLGRCWTTAWLLGDGPEALAISAPNHPRHHHLPDDLGRPVRFMAHEFLRTAVAEGTRQRTPNLRAGHKACRGLLQGYYTTSDLMTPANAHQIFGVPSLTPAVGHDLRHFYHKLLGQLGAERISTGWFMSAKSRGAPLIDSTARFCPTRSSPAFFRRYLRQSTQRGMCVTGQPTKGSSALRLTYAEWSDILK